MRLKNWMFVLIILVLSSCVATTNRSLSDEVGAVKQALVNYAAAVQSKNMSEIEKYVVTTDAFTIFEGSHINWGWQDYRDNHIGPELKQFLEISYSFSDIKVKVYGNAAYAIFKTSIAVKMETRNFDSEGLATAILIKTNENWKIQHIHTSRIPKRNRE